MRTVYSLLYYAALPVVLGRLWYRGKKAPNYRKRIGERFGQFEKKTIDERKTRLWFHTVSVGEFIAAKPLIEHFVDDGRFSVLVTCTTPTGSDRIQASLGERVFHIYCPYDLPPFLNKLITWFRPSLLVIMETELWPNMLHCCKSNSVKVVLANARMSEKSAKGYAKFPSLTQEMLNNLSAAAIQNPTDAKRFKSLGLDAKKSHITGSIKFDIDLSKDQINQSEEFKAQLSQQGKKRILVAASTHRGEDETLIKCFLQLRQKHKGITLVIVPRHPERFDEVYELCVATKLNCVRRSGTVSTQKAEQADIYLGDTMGEMMTIFGASDIAFIGGSFVDNGGHNYIEAAVWGIPVITGPSIFNFQTIAEQLKEKGALTIANTKSELHSQLDTWLSNADLAEKAGKAAKDASDDNRGALKKLISLINTTLS